MLYACLNYTSSAVMYSKVCFNYYMCMHMRHEKIALTCYSATLRIKNELMYMCITTCMEKIISMLCGGFHMSETHYSYFFCSSYFLSITFAIYNSKLARVHAHLRSFLTKPPGMMQLP